MLTIPGTRPNLYPLTITDAQTCLEGDTYYNTLIFIFSRRYYTYANLKRSRHTEYDLEGLGAVDRLEERRLGAKAEELHQALHDPATLRQRLALPPSSSVPVLHGDWRAYKYHWYS
jgi:hypothetical protein